MNRSFYSLTVVLSLGLALGGGCSKERQKNVAEREIRVTLEPLQKRVFRRQIPVQGTVWPQRVTVSLVLSLVGIISMVRTLTGGIRDRRSGIPYLGLNFNVGWKWNRVVRKD